MAHEHEHDGNCEACAELQKESTTASRETSEPDYVDQIQRGPAPNESECNEVACWMSCITFNPDCPATRLWRDRTVNPGFLFDLI